MELARAILGYEQLISPAPSPRASASFSASAPDPAAWRTMRGLREQTRARVLETFRSLHIHEPGGVLLCDKLALRAVSCACRVSEIMEEGITLVEALEIQRQPIREFAAVYLITPTVAAVNMMLDDFADPRNPKYGDVHILFTSHLPDALLAKIKTSPVVQRVKSLRELNFEYLAIESGAFTLDAPEALASIFAPSSTTAVPEQHKVASQLSTLFAMYGEMPYVRFAAKGHPASSSLAYIVQEKLDRLGHTSGCFAKQPRGADRPTLLIVDRTVDPLAPLLHEYSYQAMIHDLLPIADGERYSYRYTSNRGEELRKDVLLNETDPLWPTLRHMHIADCIEYLTTNFNQFLAANQSATKLNKKGAGVNLKEMSEALRGMPHYQEEMARYSLHISLTRELMARFKTNQLEAISTLEQNMATGEDSDGAPARCPRPARPAPPPPPPCLAPRPTARPRRRGAPPPRRQGGEGNQARRAARRDGAARHLAAGQDAAAHDVYHLAGGHPRRRPQEAHGGGRDPARGPGGHRQPLLPGRDALEGPGQGRGPAAQARRRPKGRRLCELRPLALHAGAQASGR